MESNEIVWHESQIDHEFKSPIKKLLETFSSKN